MSNVTLSTAFINGLITFFSPCVLPLLPLYFSYLAGEALTIENSKKVRTKLLINSVGFVIGISTLNVLIGFGAKFVSDYLLMNKDTIRIIGGIMMILFGVYFASGFKIPFLEKDRKYVYTKYTPNFFKSLVLGFTFSLGWSACNGPIVSSIALIASFQKDFLRAGFLMMVYSLGFAVPFFASAIIAGSAAAKLKSLNKYLGVIKVISGLILAIMGILMLMNKVYVLGI